ncbi:Fc receptor-like protein 2 [Polypterus senegalus]|uniref:Fc receptor-like protein 2 n=1 Tax=Polypterus senegalus TaxID=55291 RepID=UPI001964F85E|nr:Fc receptor-like protein 2 [Polypterus senegalus]
MQWSASGQICSADQQTSSGCLVTPSLGMQLYIDHNFTRANLSYMEHQVDSYGFSFASCLSRVLLYCLAGLTTMTFSAQGTELFDKPVLTVHPRTSLLEGDTVILICQSNTNITDIQLQYRFYKNEKYLSHGDSESQLKTLKLQKADTGSYWCEVEAKGNWIEKKASDHVFVVVQGKLALKRRNTWEPVYVGNTVILECGVDGDCSDSKYLWFKWCPAGSSKQLEGVTGCSYTIHSAALSDSGEYWCYSSREDPPYSNGVSLTVQDFDVGNTLRLGLSGLVLILILVIARMLF